MFQCSYGNVRVFGPLCRYRSVPYLRAPFLGDMTGPGSLYSPAVLPQRGERGPKLRSHRIDRVPRRRLRVSQCHHRCSTYATLTELTASRTDCQIPRVPAVPIDKSVTRDYIVCLDDGRRLKTLRRYIKRKYSLTPDQYRERWDLPDDYPMVAPGYSELRASLAMRFAKRSRKG
jgi:predicted transcriptional regulator